MSEYPVISPLSESFSCRGSGHCCITPWKVKVGLQRAEKLRNSESAGRLERQGYTPLPMSQGEAQVGRRSNGSCVFHQDQGCNIHRELGSAAKPTVCQLYPFHLVNTPDGHYLSLAFSCPSVIRGGGTPVSEQVPALVQMLRESEYYEPGALSSQVPVNLIAQRTIPWPDYLQKEPQILAQLHSQGTVMGYLRVAASILEHHQDEGSDWNPQVHSQESLMKVAEQFPFFSAYTVAFLEAKGKPAAIGEICEKLLEEEVVHSALLSRELPVFCHAPPKDEETQALLDRFAQHLVYGKRLLEGGSLISRLLGAALSISVFQFYQHAGGSTEWCFNLIETALLGHSDEASGLFQLYENRLLSLLQNEVEA